MTGTELGQTLLQKFRERAALLKDDSATQELLKMGFELKKKIVKLRMKKHVPEGTSDTVLRDAISYLERQGLTISVRDNLMVISS
jgi:hypothetical protein